MSVITTLFKRKHRRMTSYERNEAAKIKKAKRDAKKVSKKVASTLNWSHIYDITDNSIQLRKGKKQATVMGVKLSPHDIFIDDLDDQARIIENLRMALNKLPFRMFFSFVYSPVNADDHIANLMNADRIETDPIVKQMIQADFDKLVQFQNAYAELEFFVMIQERSEERLHKYFQEMTREFELAGFLPRTLNRYDFCNYLTYLYENPMINNYYFSRGTAGEETLLSKDTVVETASVDQYRDYIHIVWIGTYGEVRNPDDLVAQVKTLLSRQAKNPERFIVLGVCTVEGNHSVSYLNSFDTAMMQAFGNRYINVRKYLNEDGLADAGITPTIQDKSRVASGLVPASFLATSGSLELNGKAYALVGKLVYSRMESLGYFNEVFEELGINETVKQILKEDPSYFDRIIKNSLK